MRHWEEETCIRFKPRTTEYNYIEFFQGAGLVLLTEKWRNLAIFGQIRWIFVVKKVFFCLYHTGTIRLSSVNVSDMNECLF